jgi:very-short-patch-repair endonuclease/DNA polymerase III delta prime subunit
MSIKKKIDLARLELLDMGLRGNPLLNYRSGAKTLDVFDEVSDQVFDMLVEKNKAMRFLPIPKAYVDKQKAEEDLEDGTEKKDLPPLEEYLELEMGADRHSDIFLQTKQIPEKLDHTLLRIENESHSLLQEQGIEVLYLAIGFLKWFEDANAKTPRYAPLIMVPVELKRTSAKETFSVAYTQADLGPNLALAAKLKGEFKIALPEFNDEFDVNDYLANVEEVVASQPRWEVNHNIALGLFSFGKFQMYTDLNPDNWPEDKSPVDHPVLQGLFDCGFLPDVERIKGIEDHIATKEPETLHLVKDSDSSQTDSILAIMQGSNLVIQGPPGTGKSQTITNIISEALARGKKILFVAQKMAALEVVKQRLDESHLGDAVLELHSHKSTKKAVLESIKTTFEQGKPNIPNRDSHYDRLKEVRGQLDAYVEAIRTPILNSGLNYTSALGRLLEIRNRSNSNELPELPFDLVESWDLLALAKGERALQAIAEHIENKGVPSSNPYAVTERTALSPVEQQQLSKLLKTCSQLLAAIIEQGDQLSSEMSLPAPTSVLKVQVLHNAATRAMEAPKLSGIDVDTDDWQRRRDSIRALITAGANMKRIQMQHSDRFIEQGFDADILSIRQGLVGRADKWWRIFSGPYRAAKANLQGICQSPLDGKATDWLEWADDLLKFQSDQKLFRESIALGETLFGAQWQGENSDWEVLETISEWLFTLYEEVGTGKVPEGITKFLAGSHSFTGWEVRLSQLFNQVKDFIPKFSNAIELIEIDNGAAINNFRSFDLLALQRLITDWDKTDLLYDASRFNQLKSELAEVGLEAMGSWAQDWDKPVDGLLHCLNLSYYGGLVNTAYGQNVSIQKFDRISHERLIKEFIDLDSSLFDYSKEALVSKLYEALPNFNAPGEMDLLRREMSKKRRHIAIRRLIGETSTVLQQAKPVFMMSPMSVATYLPQGKIEFDLVIFDEASQIESPDALGAIARAKQVVVVGDSKQMPPSNFFGRAIELTDEEAEESATADVESILGMMLAKGAPERMLRWHYRSRHHSLITVSNDQFYNNKLVVFPSPGIHPDATGLKLHHLPDTHYDRGGSRSNIGEAAEIAKAVVEHARSKPHLSLGIVAFSMAQKEAVMFALEYQRRQNPDIESFFTRHVGSDEFFIKNLENVQGDERDVIYISIGYGRTTAGNVSSSFGPINREGGERRLNVLISRARLAMEVFSNILADDIKTKEASPFGVKALKAFLKYAESGEIEQRIETGKEADSPFEEEVHDAIKGLGYDVEPQVGSSGFFIDLCVRDPDKLGRYILAVECDGATYHSSASARDRDRLRQGVLEGLGWRFHRIWSTDWFRNPASEVVRLKEVIELSRAYYQKLDSGIDVAKKSVAKAEVKIERHENTVTEELVLPKYSVVSDSDLNFQLMADFSDIDSVTLKRAINKTVEIESPIHIQQLTTRLTNAAGFKKAGAKIKRRVIEHIEHLERDRLVHFDRDFISKDSNQEVTLRDWSDLESSMRKIEFVSDAELRKSIQVTVADALSIERDDCIAAALSLIGFKRLTANVKDKVDLIVTDMVSENILKEDGSRLRA